MPTRNVVITDHQEKLVEELVESGEYQNASEVLREGLRLVEKQRAEDAARLEALRGTEEVEPEDVDEGHFIGVAVDGMEDYVRSLGRRAVPSEQSSRK